MQKFIIPEMEILPSSVYVTGQDAKHIFKVLRKREGDHVAATDGKGSDYNSIILNASPESIKIKIIEKFNSVTESSIEITLCSGMLKDRKMDLVIKQITQLGVQKWMPFFNERSIPRPDIQKIQKRKKRWESIARESLKQCNRSCLPDISEPLNFETLIQKCENHDLKIAFWEKSGLKIESLKNSVSPEKIVLLIGPEGGFSNNEILMAKEKGFLSYSLGPRILRAETASTTACTIIQYLYGDM